MRCRRCCCCCFDFGILCFPGVDAAPRASIAIVLMYGKKQEKLQIENPLELNFLEEKVRDAWPEFEVMAFSLYRDGVKMDCHT